MLKFCARIILLSAIVCLAPALPAQAALSVSITPADGAGRLHFGRTEKNTKEVRIRITSSEGAQYQLFERVVEPFMNDRGEILNRNVLWATSLIGSNSSGTLYLQSPEPVGFADQLLYTSNGGGESDSFLLSYKVDPEALTASGTFLGKILYTVRQVGGSRQEEAVLNIFIDSFGDLRVTAKTASGGQSIELGTKAEAQASDAIEFSIEGNTGNIQVFQELSVYPANPQGRELDPEAVAIDVRSRFGGSGTFELERGQQRVFETGRLNEEYAVEFRLNEEAAGRQQAGLYQGRLRFWLEQDGIPKETLDFDLLIDIQPVFKMEVMYPPEGVSFEGLLPNSPPQTKEVVVAVESNLQRPYMVTQNVISPLSNERGMEFDSRYFRMNQDFVEQKRGKLQYNEFVPIPGGETPLYFSDAEGSPATFRIMYQQRPYAGMEPGHYKAAIIYSLGEL